MYLRNLCKFVVAAMIVLASLWAAPALAQNSGPCTATLPSSLALKPGATLAMAWQCDDKVERLGPGRVAVHLGEASQSAYMETRTGYFDELTLLAVRDGRVVRAARHKADHVYASLTDVSFAVPLPSAQRHADVSPYASSDIGPETYIAVFENPEFPTTILEARVVEIPVNARPQSLINLVVIAMMMGFLLLPVILDIAFYRVLKANFLLWHAALALAMAWHLSSSGAITALTPLSVNAINDHAIISFGAVIVFAIMFATHFIEKDKQDPRLFAALTGWLVVLSLLTAARVARFDAFTPISAKVYFAAFVPLLLLVIAFIGLAIRRGSRAVWFQLVAWLPFFALGIVRIVSMLYPDAPYIEATWVFRVGAVTEVSVTALGIVDRVFQLKRERDAARTEARMLERLSTRDPLTGLLNRRGLEARFDELIAQGFDTFALIDLDRFKQVNDRHGHQVGDAALVACAQALINGGNRDLVAARLGGEEFVVMLRSERALERAEALRKAIPMRIATQVEGLDAPVTASSGVIEVPRASNTIMSFEALYARADALMYEAKATGRNRMLYERLTVFDKAPPRRPISESRQCESGDDAKRREGQDQPKVA
ncbi:MAG: diguanylate cyclase [Pseudomonadota bacterium]